MGEALLKESREFASFIILRVTGDGHQGIGLSGISRSAFGSRLRAPAAERGRSTLPNFVQELSGRSDGQAVHASAEKVVEVIPIKCQEISCLLAKGGNDHWAIFGGPVDERPIKRQPRFCRNECGPNNLVPA